MIIQSGRSARARSVNFKFELQIVCSFAGALALLTFNLISPITVSLIRRSSLLHTALCSQKAALIDDELPTLGLGALNGGTDEKESDLSQRPNLSLNPLCNPRP